MRRFCWHFSMGLHHWAFVITSTHTQNTEDNWPHPQTGLLWWWAELCSQRWSQKQLGTPEGRPLGLWISIWGAWPGGYWFQLGGRVGWTRAKAAGEDDRPSWRHWEWWLLDLVQSEHPPLKVTGERQGLLWRQGLWDPAWRCPKDADSRPLTWAISEEPKQKHHPGHDGVPPRSQLLSPLSCRWGSGHFHASFHANHFLLSLPRSPDVPWGVLLEEGRCWTSPRVGTACEGDPEWWGDSLPLIRPLPPRPSFLKPESFPADVKLSDNWMCSPSCPSDPVHPNTTLPPWL